MQLSVDEAHRWVWMVRTRVPLPIREQALRQFFDEAVAAMATLVRAHHALIVDGREAVGRNDEVFERVQAEYRDRLFGGFHTVVTLVRTTAGRMQIERYRDGTRSTDVTVFSSAEDATAFLLTKSR